MTRETLAAAVLVWLIGALVGWVTGWVARGEQNRLWHSNIGRQLAETRAQLAGALDQLDEAHAQLDDARAHWVAQPASAVVHVHMPSPLVWAPGPQLAAAPVHTLTTAPLPVTGAGS